ncbi:MAG: translocation/assembly module TamB [Holosporales bacterium]|jgi:hypothetical protein|nr:translocation/assembly module TamB [Holosporales bacterium]
MVRYVVRKFIRIVLYIFTPISLLFLLLQTSYIQSLLLNSIIGNEYKIKLNKLYGIFPFDFGIKYLSISSQNQTITTENLSIKLKKNLTGIKFLLADKIFIKNAASPNFSISDIKNILPFIGQKFLRNINVKEIKINDTAIKNLKYIFDKKTKLRSIDLILNEKKVNASYKFDDNILSSNVLVDDLHAVAMYEINNNRLNIQLLLPNNREIKFNGVLSADELNGIVSIPELKSGVVISLKATEDSIDSEFYSKDFGISGNVSFNMKNKCLFANRIIFANGIVIMPFYIKENLQIESLDILLKKGKIRITDMRLSPKSFSPGHMSLENIDISQFANDNLKISGILEGSADFYNNAENFDISIKNSKFSDIKIPDIFIKGAYSKEKVDINVSYKALDKINKIAAQIFANEWIITKDNKIKVFANGIFNISDYILGKTARGIVNYSFNINGSLNNPVVSGNLSLKNGVYINKYSGTYLKNGILDAEIKNNKLMIKKIHAIDDSPTPGNVSGSGEAYFNDKDFIIDIKTNFDNLCVVDIAEFDGRVLGEISIKGNSKKGVKISGNLYSNNAKFDVSNTITKSSMAFELLEKKEEPKREKQKDIPFFIPVDIDFVFNPCLKITGFGINSKWIGGAKLSGDINNLIYDAKITLTEGKIKVSGNEFKLSSGTIWSNANNPGIFMVDVSATKSLYNLKVSARFIQNENGSDVKFSSKPYLSKRDILSYLLFDHSSSEITTGEGFTLFSVMSTLSGNEALDIMSKVKSVLGIDSMELKRRNDGENGEYDALSIGKKIGKMKISIDQGNAKDSTKASLDAKITKNSKVSIDVYGKNAPGVGIFWNKRY